MKEIERRLQGLEQARRNLGIKVFREAGAPNGSPLWYEGTRGNPVGELYTDQALHDLAVQGYVILKVVYDSAGA